MQVLFYDELLKYLTRAVQDPHEAQDLAQEAFARVQARLSAGQTVEDMRGLLYEVARNLLIDRHRHLKVRNHVPDDVLNDMPGPASDDPEAVVAGQQRLRVLLQAIEGLPPRCRQAFVLHRLDGLPQAQIAAQMGVSLNMVERHIMLAIATCRKALGEERLRKVPAAADAAEDRTAGR